MKLSLYIFVLFFLFVVSCKKEITQIPESNLPVFSLKGSINNESISINVGDGGEEFINAIDTINGVKYFKGTLVFDDSEIEIGLFDGNLDFDGVNIQKFNQLKNIHLYQENSETLFNVNQYFFKNHNEITKIEWYVNSIFYSLNEIKISKPGKYNVCAKVFFKNGEHKILCNNIILGFKRNSIFSLEYNYNPISTQLYTWINCDNSIQSINWFINDTIECTCPYMTKTIDKLSHHVTTEIYFNDGSKRKRTVLVDGNNDKMSIADFARVENYSNVINDYAAKITYRKNGIEYCSSFIENENKMNIRSFLFIGKDENNDKIYQIKGNVVAKLFSKETNEKIDVNFDVSWGLILK
jgi:hypothetical protein